MEWAPQLIGVMMLCSPDMEGVFTALEDHYSETPSAYGRVVSRRNQNPTMILTRHEQSWSIVIVGSENTCVAFTGDSFNEVELLDKGAM